MARKKKFVPPSTGYEEIVLVDLGEPTYVMPMPPAKGIITPNGWIPLPQPEESTDPAVPTEPVDPRDRPAE